MNRAAYRREARSAAHAMRQHGCNCQPTVTAVDPALWPPGCTMGYAVRHQSGCALGDRMLALNKAGILLALIDAIPPRCQR
jgi:hypothetical protein